MAYFASRCYHTRNNFLKFVLDKAAKRAYDDTQQLNRQTCEKEK